MCRALLAPRLFAACASPPDDAFELLRSPSNWIATSYSIPCGSDAEFQSVLSSRGEPSVVVVGRGRTIVPGSLGYEGCELFVLVAACPDALAKLHSDLWRSGMERHRQRTLVRAAIGLRIAVRPPADRQLRPDSPPIASYYVLADGAGTEALTVLEPWWAVDEAHIWLVEDFELVVPTKPNLAKDLLFFEGPWHDIEAVHALLRPLKTRGGGPAVEGGFAFCELVTLPADGLVYDPPPR